MGIRITTGDLAKLEAMGAKIGPPIKLPDVPPSKTLMDALHPGHPTPLAAAWTFMVPNWMPTPNNKLYDKHWAVKHRQKRSDFEIVAYFGRLVPEATGKRNVSLHVVFPPRQRMPDIDAPWKSLLDALVRCRLLVNDSAAWASMEPVSYSRGDRLTSFVTLMNAQ
jgi:hypothetical protein